MTKTTIQPPHVIVVDDEPGVRTFVRRVLEPAGYIVEESGDPHEACATAETGRPLDLLIADFQMPELTGDEVARRFRAARPDVKVLFITGYTDALFDQCSQLWDGEAFLEKPFTRAGLLEAISLLLFGRLNQEARFAAPRLAAAGVL